MKYVVSAGGIVIRDKNNQIEICLIKFYLDKSKYSFPKGHPENDELLEETALREVKEEVGLLDLQVIKYLGSLVRKATEKTGEIVDKEIKMFLMTTNNFVHIETEEDYEYEWVNFDKAIKLMQHQEERDFLIKNREDIFLVK
ncbi:MAG: NUDIX domain-containing protein [Candidatus Shapirobacteria bacterium]